MISKTCTCLTLYDWEGRFDLRSFRDLAVQFFADNGVEPDMGGLVSDRPLKIQSYRRLSSKLTRMQQSPWRGLELYHTTQGYSQLAFGWDVSACIYMSKERTLYLCCDNTRAGIGLDYFDSTLDSLSKTLRLSYGIGYYRPFEFGPSLYALGMEAGLGDTQKDLVAVDRISAWFHERAEQNRHLQGYLRDVYPLNVLSAPHLHMPVNGIPLEDWIATSADRGTLRPLAGGAWLWRVDEQHVPAITAELEQAGLLIAALGATR